MSLKEAGLKQNYNVQIEWFSWAKLKDNWQTILEGILFYTYLPNNHSSSSSLSLTSLKKPGVVIKVNVSEEENNHHQQEKKKRKTN